MTLRRLLPLVLVAGCAPSPELLVPSPGEDDDPPAARVESASYEPAISDLLAAQVEVDLGEAWVYPLAGDKRIPQNPGRLFGADRPGDRPWECGRGHCGIDLGNRHGAVVYAMSAGTLTRVVRRDRGRAGRYIRIRHPGGLRSDYLHLDRIRQDLRVGNKVRAGEPIGTVGRTGVKFSGPHLHFALARQRGEQWDYVDPEPLLRQAWTHGGARSLPELLHRERDQRLVWSEDPEATGVIALDVRDAHSGRPLDGARVVARGPGGSRATGHPGPRSIRLRHLSPGPWRVTISLPGYTAVHRTLEARSGQPDHAVPSERIDLERGAVLRGVVRDRDGERVPGATVRLGRVSATTDADGRFHLEDAPTGEVELEALHDFGEARQELTLVPGDELVTLQLTLD